MPFESHDDFHPPADSNATIWRYMDLAKFLSLLDRAALYFPRVDRLSAADPYEGYHTDVSARLATLKYEDMPADYWKQLKIEDQTTHELLVLSFRQTAMIAKGMRETSFVNSWHVLEYESAAMWALYLRSQDGIAIQSTYKRLVDSMAEYADFGVFVGLVKYIDYQRDVIPFGQALFPMMHKRKSFEHEHELRALIWTVANNKNEMPFEDPKVNKYRDVPGIYVNVDLNTLINQVYVAPTAPKWITELVAALLKRYGFNKNIVHSQLAATPLR